MGETANIKKNENQEELKETALSTVEGKREKI
jgi:hypothetical protein